jgi:hypothetical protein
MYETEKQARDAVGKLRAEGFPKNTVLRVSPAAESTEETVEPLSIAIQAGFLRPSDARIYTALLEQGRYMVSVRAPFGEARSATEIMDGFDPVDAGIPKPQKRSIAWEVGAPLSSALLLPILSRHGPDAFSMSFGFPTLTSGPTPRYGSLASSDYALFGQPSLSRNPAPLSSLFNMPTLSGKSGPSWTSSLGFPMLSQSPAPLSSLLGMHLLRGTPRHSEPAPFSASIGMPPLSHGRTFLSRWFGELGSPHFALFGRNPLIDKAAPLSSMFGLKILSAKARASWRSSFGLPLLTRGQGPVLGTIPMLSRNPTPLSSLFGMRVLSIYQ